MRRSLALLVLASLAGCGRAPPSPAAQADKSPALEVVELSASDARDRMAAGTLTSVALTDAYLARIAAVDDAGPTLNAVIELNPDARADAARLDAERQAGRVRGPLHGLPVLLKDNIDATGMANSAGSLALAKHVPARDAFLVARLREAGAVILGKANLSEWANFRSTRSTSGWSSRGGQTRNPYVLDRNPCGSSSGSAVAVAASLASVAVGTETDGSILCPAAVNGVVGLKPTVGLVSRSGIIPISISQDTAGPMGREVEDVAMLLDALAGVDEDDPAGKAAGTRAATDYLASLDAQALRGKRLGLLRQAMGAHPGADAATERAVAVLRAAGAEVIDVEIPDYGRWGDAELAVLLFEFKDGLDAYLRGHGATPGSLAELIAWNSAHAGDAMPHFGQELFEQAQAKGTLSDREYTAARATIRRLAVDGLNEALDAQRLDALVAPTTSPAWLTDPVLGDHYLGAGYGIAAVAGTPSLTVPMGDVRGLPLGLTFMGRAWSEPELLALGYAFEQATRARRAPRYLETLD